MQPAGATAHPVVGGDVIHPGVCIDGRNASLCPPGPEEETFSATATVEVRLALGGERDWDFDWTEFTVGETPTGPLNADDCKKGGWKIFGFRYQGQYIRFVNTGKPAAAPPQGENRGRESRLHETPHSSTTSEHDAGSETVIPAAPPVPERDEPTGGSEAAANSGRGKSDAAKSAAAKHDAPKGPPSRKGSTD